MDAPARFARLCAHVWVRVAILAALLFPGMMLSVRAAEPTTAQTPVRFAHPGTLVGRTSPAQTIIVAAGFKPASPKALDAFLTDLYNPASPTYHRYLTPQQYTQRFFDPAARKQVTSYLQAQGFTVNDPGIGSGIDATGTVGQMERAFNVRLSDYRDAKGQIFHTNDVTPAIPVSIATLIHGIIGLDNAPAAVHLGQGNTAIASAASPDAPTREAVCAGAQGQASSTAYLPAQFATAYHLDDLLQQGYHGEGQKIAFFQFADYHDADPAAYQVCFGTHVPLTRILVDGGPTGASQYDGEEEVDIDIEVVVGLAPNLAGIYNYMSPNSFAGAFHQYLKIANDNLAPIVSISWGWCEPTLTLLPGVQNFFHVAFQQMAAQGQTVFSGTGDSGSTSCLPANQGGTHQLATFYPSTDQYVTAVGGTHVTINSTTGAWVSEAVWSDPAHTNGGGDGVSMFWNRFAYQHGPGTDNPALNPGSTRMVPDVTITGDVQYVVYYLGGWTISGGTSMGGPHWAAGAALMNQYLLDHGKNRIGFANPALYAIFDSASYSSTFRDITTGTNCVDPASTCTTGNLYTATAGYDMASGIGSPLFSTLAAAFAFVPLSPTITGIAPGSGPAPGGTPVTITGTNFVAGMGVYFGATFVLATNIVVVSSTTITATVPASATGGRSDVTLTTPAPGLAQITLPGGYTYLANALPGQAPQGGIRETRGGCRMEDRRGVCSLERCNRSRRAASEQCGQTNLVATYTVNDERTERDTACYGWNES